MSEQTHLSALETLVADGQREIVRRLARLDQVLSDGAHAPVPERTLPDLEAWKADLDKYLLLQRTAFGQTVRSELPSAWVATARTLRRQLRIQTAILILFVLISLTQSPWVLELFQRWL